MSSTIPPDRDEAKIAQIEAYLKAVRMFRDFSDASQDPVFSEVRSPVTTSGTNVSE